MNELTVSLTDLAKAFIMLFVVMDPPGNIPILLAITGGMSVEERHRELKSAVIVAGVLLFTFAFLGKAILYVLNIELDSFMVAGGILLLLIALNILQGTYQSSERESGSSAHIVSRSGVGAVPIGTPLLAGPGAITTVMTILQTFSDLTAILAIIAAIIATWIVLSLSEQIYGILGEKGSSVLSKVVAIIVAAIAVQFIVEGLRNLFPVLE